MTRITIISGFLGVGKTTFANRLLDYYIRTGEKTAYVVNEFGQTGLDSALMEKQGFQTVDIFGGCICCTLRGKITEALRDIMCNYEPERIVFEPSGIFLFEKFLDVLQDEYLRGKCEVDSVLTVVDSTHVNDAMFVPGNFFANQIAHADTMIISKLESYDGDAGALAERLRTLNERAAVIAKPWSELVDEDYAGLNKGGSEGILADHDDHHEHEHHDHDDHDHHEHEHEHGSKHSEMDSITIAPREFDAEAVRQLQELIKEGGFGKLYRIKGKVRYEGAFKVLQVAFDTLSLDDCAPDGDCALTFIGAELDKLRIQECWGRK